MLKVDELIVVEGKYDKIRLGSVIDGTIVTTDGFAVYRDREKRRMLKAMAKEKGIVILTDSDRAGFQIRGFLKSVVGDAKIKNVYIPEIRGKEKRKEHPSKDGLLGVEGMDADTLIDAFLKAGVGKPAVEREQPEVTKLDFYADGLSGGADSARRRQQLAAALSLPAKLSANALLEAVNALLGRRGYRALVDRLFGEEQPPAHPEQEASPQPPDKRK